MIYTHVKLYCLYNLYVYIELCDIGIEDMILGDEKMENIKKLKPLKCRNCGNEIEEGDEIYIDSLNHVYDSEICLFAAHRKSYRKYEARKDRSSNFIDLGLIDMKYIGDYDSSALEYI